MTTCHATHSAQGVQTWRPAHLSWEISHWSGRDRQVNRQMYCNAVTVKGETRGQRRGTSPRLKSKGEIRVCLEKVTGNTLSHEEWGGIKSVKMEGEALWGSMNSWCKACSGHTQNTRHGPWFSAAKWGRKQEWSEYEALVTHAKELGSYFKDSWPFIKRL